jgi:hypothetical protein
MSCVWTYYTDPYYDDYAICYINAGESCSLAGGYCYSGTCLASGVCASALGESCAEIACGSGLTCTKMAIGEFGRSRN